jgi:hypothetical protein
MPPLRLVNRRDAKRGKRLNSTALGALYFCHYDRHPSTLLSTPAFSACATPRSQSEIRQRHKKTL